MTSYLTSIDTFSLSRTVFEIFDFKLFRFWPRPLTPEGHLRSKYFIPFESPYVTSYLTFIDIFSLSRTVFEIFDFSGFDLWPLKVIWGHIFLYHSKALIWFPIWLLLTLILYLVPFLKYLTSNFSGFKSLLFDTRKFDLDLWPLKVIWGQKFVYHLKALIWLPIWLLLTLSLYLVPFLRYLSWNFSGLGLDFWPLKANLRWIFYTIRKPSYYFLFDFYWHFLSI